MSHFSAQNEVVFGFTLFFNVAPMAIIITSYSLISYKIRKNEVNLNSVDVEVFNRMNTEAICKKIK